MKTHKQLFTHESILQVLPEHGCPFCRFLKEFQTARLQTHLPGNSSGGGATYSGVCVLSCAGRCLSLADN